MAIGRGEQFRPEFLAITPNHRIPAIVDPDGPGGKPLKLFESGAILMYLSEKSGGKLIPKDQIGRYKCLQWLMFQMGGIGPMFGQWNHFASYAPEKIPYAIDRYTNEVHRLYRVLEKRLSESPYLAGDEYSIADICTYPWVRNPDRRGVAVEKLPGVQRWLDVVGARPAVQRGVEVLAEISAVAQSPIRSAKTCSARRNSRQGKPGFNQGIPGCCVDGNERKAPPRSSPTERGR